MALLCRVLSPLTKCMVKPGFTVRCYRNVSYYGSTSNNLCLEELTVINFCNKLPQGHHQTNTSQKLKKTSVFPSTSIQWITNCLHDINIVNSIPKIDDNFEKRNQLYELPELNANVEMDIEREDVAIEESPYQKQLPMQAGKSDLKWRRRAMRRHRLLRWRKKFRKLVQARDERREANRKRLQNENLETSWKMYNLTTTPPELTEEEKKRLVKEWREEGVWDDALTPEEYQKFARVTSIMRRDNERHFSRTKRRK
ncbi:uncharacterized protein LOC143449568 [Clavelina lepadiformis]|uniref:Mitochondrial mRNA-processing protein COX24 C-terminal domain-containing protein n=1 Tax=Clavelina lepadiformis TaxID=159417 RepID=A0ABP0H3K6_CLALP